MTKNHSESARPHSTDPTVNTAIAARNTARVPYRSATQPLAGMNTATLSRYAVSATFMRTGSEPNALAIVGNAVAITVESRFCMNSAQATITAVWRVRRLVRGGLDMRFWPELADRLIPTGWPQAAASKSLECARLSCARIVAWCMDYWVLYRGDVIAIPLSTFGARLDPRGNAMFRLSGALVLRCPDR
jgi:hypothetical protein